MSVLEEIVARTRERVAERRRLPLDQLAGHVLAARGPARRPFAQALARPGVNVIAEFKRRSPSRGLLRDDLHPGQVAAGLRDRGRGGAVRPDRGGVLRRQPRRPPAGSGRHRCLPTLRKDFVVDPYQVWEARVGGGRRRPPDRGRPRRSRAAGPHGRRRTRRGWRPWWRSTTGASSLRALGAEARLVGVNNRDLKTLEVSLDTALALAPQIPDDVVAVAESGIRHGDDVRRLRDAGYDAFLVGEHLMAAPDPGDALRALIVERAEPEQARVREGLRDHVAGGRGPRPRKRGPTRWASCSGRAARARVDVATARRIAEALPPFVVRVGVFVDAPREELVRTADEARLDLLQLHGGEPPEVARRPAAAGAEGGARGTRFRAPGRAALRGAGRRPPPRHPPRRARRGGRARPSTGRWSARSASTRALPGPGRGPAAGERGGGASGRCSPTASTSRAASRARPAGRTRRRCRRFVEAVRSVES